MRQAVLYQDETGVWVAEVPSLPGCISQGATRDEALANIADAAEAWIEGMTELGEPVPEAPGRVEVHAIPGTAA
ncbi:MAG TPA: hypothetical protein DEB06_00080 [Phycisphaerales bacterium]|nr:hypothetical protein [Phycisphaerales bacterium]